MKDKKYLVTDCKKQFSFCVTKNEAAEIAEKTIDHIDDIIYIYEIKCIGKATIPEPGIVVDWE